MPAIAERKCRECGKWSKVAFGAKLCQYCMAEYGRWEIGMDREILVEVAAKGKRR